MAFTPEQREILLAMQRLFETMATAMIAAADRRTRAHITALNVALVRKGLITEDELYSTRAEIEAGMAVEDALSPDIQAALDEINRILGGEVEATEKKR